MKVIFLTGGVYSSLGKGVLLSSIGKVLQFEGYQCDVLKFDPYLNYNSKFLSPLQHGEVFVTKDGEETDLDLGHYERFLGITIDSNSCCTTGKVYYHLLNKEREGKFRGETVQVAPHLVQEIISKLSYFEEKNTEILLIELGGTVFDVEQQPFLIAADRLKNQKPKHDMIFIHVAPMLSLNYNGERKTKPIQHSIALLKKMGISPDMLILKGNSTPSSSELSKISANFPSIPQENIISSPYTLDIYEIPLHLYRKEKLFTKLASLLQLETKGDSKRICLRKWEEFNDLLKQPKKYELNVTIVGKYSSSKESYYSILQSLKFAGLAQEAKLNIKVLPSDELTSETQLKGSQVICIPPGFGNKSLDGILLSIKFARERKIPFLAICLGMQLTIIEFFRNVLNISEANSLEFDPTATFPIIEPWKKNKDMRLGVQEVTLENNTLLKKIYSTDVIKPRHRHRYIFNLNLATKNSKIKESELVISAWSDNIVEGIELKNHPFFVGVQYHPEFDSKPWKPEPLFSALISAAISQNY